jgi:hypothetical protein
MEQPGRYPVSKEACDLTKSGPLISRPNVRVWLKPRVQGATLLDLRSRSLIRNVVNGFCDL